MKPFRVFVFLVIVFFISWLISWLVVEYKPILCGFKIKSGFTDTSSPITNRPAAYIVSVAKMIEQEESVILGSNQPRLNNIVRDSISKIDSSIVQNFEFPVSLDTMLFPVFREFRAIHSTHKLIRILHYGDSQIEGDRITSYFRNQLQLKFGGSGIGMIPVVSVANSSISYACETSGNWKRYSIRAENVQMVSKRTGSLLSFSKFGLGGKSKDEEGWIRLLRTSTAYPLSSSFKQCRIFYGFNSSPLMVEASQSGNIIDAEIVPASHSLEELQWTLDSPEELTISFHTANPPEVYGIALDGLSGIAVDNISLRGSSGLDFTKADLIFLKTFYEKLNIKLLVLQFGANVAPTILNNYKYYEKNFGKELTALRSAIPGISIVVIGINDLSRNGENGYESYPNIEKIRDAQRNAALNNNCAFWDLFKAMGGRNSMAGWVLANPPLAQKDFVHFSPKGAKIVGELFYRAFLTEYQRFEKVER